MFSAKPWHRAGWSSEPDDVAGGSALLLGAASGTTAVLSMIFSVHLLGLEFDTDGLFIAVHADIRSLLSSAVLGDGDCVPTGCFASRRDVALREEELCRRGCDRAQLAGSA